MESRLTHFSHPVDLKQLAVAANPYQGFAKKLVDKYQQYISTKNHFTSISDANEKMVDDSELADFELAAQAVESALIESDITTWQPQQLVEFLQKIHKLLATSVYQSKQYSEQPGEFRRGMGWVLRHKKADAPYTQITDYGQMVYYITNDPQFGKKTGLEYLIGYYKIVIASFKDKTIVATIQTAIQTYARKSKLPFNKSCLTQPLSDNEKAALNIVYKIFVAPEQIPARLLKFAENFLNDIKTNNISIYNFYAKYYLEYIEIHPFQDCNARELKILLNIVLVKAKLNLTMLDESNARYHFDHFYAKDPNVNNIVAYLQSLNLHTSSMTGLSTALGNLSLFSGKDLLFAGVKEEDKALWKEMIEIGDDQSIQAVIKAKKSYLLVRVIGNPEHPIAKAMRHNESHYGNTMLHNRMINSHESSLIRSRKTDEKTKALLESNRKGAEYLLRYYELKKTNAAKTTGAESQNKLAEIQKAITLLDIEGKTSLLLACKNINPNYAIRLLKLDSNKDTINIADHIEKRAPLHIACILGLAEVAELLLQLEANTELTDSLGHKPFYYLTCEDNETKEYISVILDSVGFFYGWYFDNADRESVIAELVASNKAMREKFSAENLIPRVTPPRLG
jgi:hypothetical protein